MTKTERLLRFVQERPRTGKEIATEAYLINNPGADPSKLRRGYYARIYVLRDHGWIERDASTGTWRWTGKPIAEPFFTDPMDQVVSTTSDVTVVHGIKVKATTRVRGTGFRETVHYVKGKKVWYGGLTPRASLMVWLRDRERVLERFRGGYELRYKRFGLPAGYGPYRQGTGNEFRLCAADGHVLISGYSFTVGAARRPSRRDMAWAILRDRHDQDSTKYSDRLGFRIWNWNHQTRLLDSPYRPLPWDGPVAVSDGHGIYAMKVPRDWLRSRQDRPRDVVGIVERYGEYKMGEHGWIAHRVRIRALAVPYFYEESILQELRDRYRVPVLRRIQ